MNEYTHTAVDRFLRYVQIDTQSAPQSLTNPSTEKQKDLSRVLVQELLDIGIAEATVTQYMAKVVPCHYVESEGRFLVFRDADRKTLESVNYSPADLERILDTYQSATSHRTVSRGMPMKTAIDRLNTSTSMCDIIG